MADQATEKRPTGRWLIWLFAGVGVLAALAIIWLAAMAAIFSMRMGGERAEPAQVAAKEPKQSYSVQQVDRVRGTTLLAIAIGVGTGQSSASEDPYGSSSSRGASDQRNLILLDKPTGANRRLLPGNDRSILDVTFLPAAPTLERGHAQRAVTEAEEAESDAKTKTTPPPMAYYAVVVRQKDGKLQDVLIGSLASGAQAWVLTGIDGIDRMWMITPTRLGLLLRQGMKLQYRVIDIPALKTVAARPVDIG